MVSMGTWGIELVVDGVVVVGLVVELVWRRCALGLGVPSNQPENHSARGKEECVNLRLGRPRPGQEGQIGLLCRKRNKMVIK